LNITDLKKGVELEFGMDFADGSKEEMSESGCD